MTKVNSSAPSHARKIKAKKPHKDFPLTPHPSGRWCKKIKGKLHYFGSSIDDPKGVRALDRWLVEKDDLLAGRVPRAAKQGDGLALHELVNAFLTTKKTLLESKDLAAQTFYCYHAVCGQLIETFGRDRLVTDIRPEDFEGLRAKWAKSWGPVRLHAEINRARVVFNYAFKNGMVQIPVRFGEGFKRPSKKVLRLNRAEQGVKMFEAAELRRMIDGAIQPMKAMILFAVNAGLGNNDVGLLPLKAIDLDGGWLNYPRPKTGIVRRCPLWPETVAALREWLAERPAPKTESATDLVFLTFRGNGWTADLKDRPITKETRKLLDRLGIKGNRNFYAIRHTFETVGGESLDQVAVDALMGHDDGSMASVYREGVADERLRRVVEYVRKWLHG